MLVTPRELEVARLVVEERTNEQIARELGIGLATVKTHLIHLMRRADCATRVGIAVLYVRGKLVVRDRRTGRYD